MWETGGGATNTGNSMVIAGPHGEVLRPLYIKTGGHLACGEHSLFVVGAGTVVVSASHHRGDFEIKVYRLTGKFSGKEAEAEIVACYSRGEWEGPLWDEADSGFLRKAVDAAADKARCYHCREPHFMMG